MGLLDDAIREHLDLKRKHGVPEAELQRQEEEALGPARRDVASQDEGSETAAAEAGSEVATTTATEEPQETGEALFEEDGADDVAPSDAPAEFMAAPDEPEAAAPEPPAEEPEVPVDDHSAEPGPETPSGDTPPRGFGVASPAPHDSGATQEYDAFAAEKDDADDLFADEDDEQEAGDEDAEGEGDVLEDTPDFLQETPEHDRLWFEQKPPRDFDFD